MTGQCQAIEALFRLEGIVALKMMRELIASFFTSEKHPHWRQHD
jgi:hypothetical protein